MADAFALANAFVRIRPTATGFRAEADAEIQRQLAGLGPTIKINASTKAAAARAKELQDYIRKLADRTYTLRLGADDKDMQAKLTRLYGQLLKLDSRVVSPKITLAGFTRAQAELLTIDAALDRAALAAEGAGKKASLSGKGWDSLWRMLGKSIPLAGGLLGHIAVWHLLLDTLVEIVAVWLAAAIAVAAFAVAGMKAAREVATQVHSMNTVMNATGAIIPPMTGNFRKLQDAIRPRVYQLAGAGLAIMAHQGSAFSTIAMGASHVLDVFAARLAIALTGGRGMGRFLQGAVPVLKTLGEAFAAFGVILGNVFKALPGFAEMLLNIGTGMLKMAAAATTFILPALKILFWLHGAVVWGGLAVTAILGLGKAFRALLAIKVVAAIAGAVAEVITFTAAAGVSTAATYAYAAALAVLGEISPFGWALIAVGILAGLTIALMHVRSSADKFGDSMQAMISKVPVQNALTTVASAITLTTGQWAKATQQLNTVQHEQGRVLGGSARSVNSYYGQVQQAALKQSAFAKQNVGLNETLRRGRDHVAQLSRAYGGNAAAQGLLVAAGVTTDQLLTRSAGEWAVVMQMVKDTSDAYKFMGATGSVLSNDMEVLNQQASTQVQAVDKLNQAWDAFIQGVSEGQQSFDTFALGQVTLRQNMDKANQATQTATHHLGELKFKTDLTGASMDGLSQASLSLNQAFATQVQNAASLIDSLRSASIGGHEFRRAIKDMVIQMLPFAKGSQEATAQLFALAEEAGIHGPATMANLVRWLGKTHGATGDLKKIMNEATIQEALLTAAMDDQAKFIRNQLLSAINSAIIKYSGVTTAATNYGKAVAGSGKSSDEAQAKFDILTKKIFDAEVQMGKGRLAALRITAAILGIPKSRTLHILEQGVGRFTIHGALPGGVPVRPGGGAGIRGGAATGMLVTTGSGPTADDNLVRVSKGELIVPANMVSHGAVDHLRGSIPGFASGGLVQQSGAPILSGRSVLDFDKRFTSKFTSMMEVAMTAAMKAAIATARAAAASGFGGISGGGGGGPNVAIGQRMAASIGWTGNNWLFLKAGWNEESGWRTNAQNPAGTPYTAAYGIPQSNPGSKMAAAGSDWLTNPVTQIKWGLGYIRSTYGSPTGVPLWSASGPLPGYKGYAGGTAGASPGWAVVGEQGPELVKMSGGETVIPAGLSGMARGGLVKPDWAIGKHGMSLSQEVAQALGIIRAHPFAPDRQFRLQSVLNRVLGRIHGERSLLRLPGLAGFQRANLLHHLHHDERRRKWLLHELGPVRGHIRAVDRAEHRLQGRIRDLRAGIHFADKAGYGRLEDQLKRHLHFRQYQMSELADWARYPTPRVLNRESRRQAHSIIESVLGDMGLPTAGFDKGGYLMPGATLAVNRTGRPERVGGGGGPTVRLEIRTGSGQLDRALADSIRATVRDGGGDIQSVLGAYG